MGEIVDSRHQQDLYIDGRETITDSGVSGKAPALQLTQQHTQGHQGLRMERRLEQRLLRSKKGNGKCHGNIPM